MSKNNNFDIQMSFFSALNYFYITHKKEIKRSYKDLTKKYLEYNDPGDDPDNPQAFLRKPQYEALEMYIFIKEYLDNASVSNIFKDWMEQKGKFANSNKIGSDNGKQIELFHYSAEEFKQVYEMLLKYKEIYSNYIFALAMGLGKTILMATCIFYEFLLANKYPNDPKYCHNALVFAPDKTVLQSLKEIQTFDKSKVIPKEYVGLLDSNIKFHFLEETGTTLNTLDDSDFNIIISNNQKIILKKKHVQSSAIQLLFDDSQRKDDVYGTFAEIYGTDQPTEEGDLIFNQRFEKLTRLSQLGVYVDEAHHLFGKDLNKDLYGEKSTLRTTINILANRLNQKGSRVVACYNYTGTPYVGNTILPEVVYSYGLKEAIQRGFLKEAKPMAFENVKSETFIKEVVKNFWNTYGENRYEGMLPKLAIYGAEIKEVEDEIVPALEKVLSELNISSDKILVNVGDSKLTKDDDIREFNNLDTNKSNKQFIVLVGKGKEGWNCRSLFGVALYRSPNSTIFVLQATMRCLRKITNIQQTASVYLSKDNYDILDNELNKNFKMSVSDMSNKDKKNKKTYEVKVLPPPRYIKLKKIEHKYDLVKKYNPSNSIDLQLDKIDLEKYKSKVIIKDSLTSDMTAKISEMKNSDDNIKYSKIMLCSEISRYIGDIKCLEVEKILGDNISKVIELVSNYNLILYDWIIPKIVDYVYEVDTEVKTYERDVLLLKEPDGEDYYTFSADPDLVISDNDLQILGVKNKSFHADTYCFDSKPEKELFLQYINNKKIKEIYFTGMFTSNQSEFYIQYIDPDSNRLRKYYPDFIAKFENGDYEIIEVKGDNKIDDAVVNAKKEAAEEVATESKMKYTIYPSSVIMNHNVLDEEITYDTNEYMQEDSQVAEDEK